MAGRLVSGLPTPPTRRLAKLNALGLRLHHSITLKDYANNVRAHA
ncbi:hypothetical protein ACQPYK_32195 [Streptosporangium sp. CA-135522]